MMMLVAVIDINIVATIGADLNHFVRNIFKNDFMRLLYDYNRSDLNWTKQKK